jgi:hypothetical protein
VAKGRVPANIASTECGAPSASLNPLALIKNRTGLAGQKALASAPFDKRQDAPKPLSGMLAGLSDPRGAIIGPRRDALLFWGAPLISLLAVKFWLVLAALQSAANGDLMASELLTFSIVITYGHLIAVVPRAYLNREVFAANRRRLTYVPIILIAAMIASPTAFAVMGTIAIFWDVHHSAMQNFGLTRIYDLKAGNKPDGLRKTDLRLNWFLYVGPLAAGACLMMHLHALDRLGSTRLSTLAKLPGVLEGELSTIAIAAMLLWAGAIGMAVAEYRRAVAAGYQIPPYKLALIVTTGFVSLMAWGFSSPLVAFASINIYHAVQYFALVWLKEGPRMTAAIPSGRWAAPIIFGGLCGAFGVAYSLAVNADIRWLGALFLACSVLHFWYDGFVWSVTKKQV